MRVRLIKPPPKKKPWDIRQGAAKVTAIMSLGKQRGKINVDQHVLWIDEERCESKMLFKSPSIPCSQCGVTGSSLAHKVTKNRSPVAFVRTGR